jgi:hypothetical protein
VDALKAWKQRPLHGPKLARLLAALVVKIRDTAVNQALDCRKRACESSVAKIVRASGVFDARAA